ncbi:hypothetical protein BLA29_001171 [Euroglyphus maynei]|uniref:Uncharacterized protein n=1 Tax=Euroglyphus maynei TaxID=6958 RepID=A0A1Y3AQC8_EURMA|nr:hypothetical protein BLA29_001171 [Euroglyphus maynei]
MYHHIIYRLNIRASPSPLSLIRLFLLSMIIMNLIYPIRMLSMHEKHHSILVKPQQKQHRYLNNNADLVKTNAITTTAATAKGSSSINTTILSETLESVTALLSTSKSTIKPMSTKERNRLTKMVEKVIRLARDVLDLNYTITTSGNKADHSTANDSGERNLGKILNTDLFNPCQPTDVDLINLNTGDMDRYRLEHTNEVTENVQFHSPKYEIGFDLLQEMIERSNHLKGIVTDMIRKDISRSVIMVYQTLANQTAHLYSLWNEQNRHQSLNDCRLYQHHVELTTIRQQQQRQRHRRQQSDKIFDSIDISRIKLLKEKRLIEEENFLIVSNNLRSLLCYLNQAIHFFGIKVPVDDIIDQVLSHQTDYIERQYKSCGWRSIFECQLMRDAVGLFADLEAFLRNESHRFLTIN